MNFSKHFTLKQFCRTNRNIKFIPTPENIANMQNLCIYLAEPIREFIGRPLYITINGGFRPEPLNSLIGGSKTSDHISGKACDLDDKETTQIELFRNICNAIRDLSLNFKQIIYEIDSNCVHISYDINNNKRELLIRYKDNTGKRVYLPISISDAISFNGDISKFL